MVATTAFAGFTGHTFQGSFDFFEAAPLASATIVGGFLGGKLAVKTRPAYLRTLFAVSTLAAAVLLIVTTVLAR